MDRRSFIGTFGALAGLGALNAEAVMAQSPQRRVLWAANVRTKSLDDRLVAANAGEFDTMSVFPIDYKAWRAEGVDDAGIRRRFADAGVVPAILDPFVQWTPGFAIPDGYPAENVAFIDTDEAEAFAIAEALGATQMNVVEGLNQPHERDALVDALGSLADRAAARGLSLGLEPMPISSIRSLADGWDLVDAVARPNLGLTFDTWHFWRAEPDHALLRAIPGDRIFDVQMVDGAAVPNGDLLNDLLHHRLLPGEGAFDLETTVGVLKEIGGWRSVGPELFSDAMDALDAEDAGRIAGRNLTEWS